MNRTLLWALVAALLIGVVAWLVDRSERPRGETTRAMGAPPATVPAPPVPRADSPFGPARALPGPQAPAAARPPLQASSSTPLPGFIPGMSPPPIPPNEAAENNRRFRDEAAKALNVKP